MASISFALMTMALGTVGLVKGTENQHAQQYAALCAVLRVAEATPSLPKVPTGEQKTKVMNEIYDLSNKTTSELSGLGTKAARLLQIKVSLAVKRAQQMFKKLDETISEAKGARGKAQVSLRKAIYGEDYKDTKGEDDEPTELTKQNIFDDPSDVANSCGGTASAQQDAGKTLINDFYCVCLGKNTGVTQVCANGVTQGGSTWTQLADSGGNTFAKDKWKKVKEKCPPRKGELTVSSITQALAAFHAQLGKGAGTSDTNAVGPTLLGTMTLPGTGCDGSAKTQACVLYHKVLKANGIPWENKMREAQNEMRTMDEKAREASSWFVKLQDQEDLLRDLYNETMFEVENKALIPASHSGKTGPADKSESIISSGKNQDGQSLSNALSNAVNPRFILPWTLLL